MSPRPMDLVNTSSTKRSQFPFRNSTLPSEGVDLGEAKMRYAHIAMFISKGMSFYSTEKGLLVGFLRVRSQAIRFAFSWAVRRHGLSESGRMVALFSLAMHIRT